MNGKGEKMKQTKHYETPEIIVSELMPVDCLVTSQYDNDVLDQKWDFSKF